MGGFGLGNESTLTRGCKDGAGIRRLAVLTGLFLSLFVLLLGWCWMCLSETVPRAIPYSKLPQCRIGIYGKTWLFIVQYSKVY